MAGMTEALCGAPALQLLRAEHGWRVFHKAPNAGEGGFHDTGEAAFHNGDVRDLLLVATVGGGTASRNSEERHGGRFFPVGLVIHQGFAREGDAATSPEWSAASGMTLSCHDLDRVGSNTRCPE
mmetsp:Transcript_64497/g.178829  ORF Transcript_64497/g.178829 Transcript_64497/m.178829 type:complete len:124 (+) Transcript_64497:164-535(+)